MTAEPGRNRERVGRRKWQQGSEASRARQRRNTREKQAAREATRKNTEQTRGRADVKQVTRGRERQGQEMRTAGTDGMQWGRTLCSDYATGGGEYVVVGSGQREVSGSMQVGRYANGRKQFRLLHVIISFMFFIPIKKL